MGFTEFIEKMRTARKAALVRDIETGKLKSEKLALSEKIARSQANIARSHMGVQRERAKLMKAGGGQSLFGFGMGMGA